MSLLAPFVAALVGASASHLISGRVPVRIVGPLAILAGVVVELVVRGDYPKQLKWLPAVLIVVGVLAAIVLTAFRTREIRMAAVGGALVALLIAPSVRAFDTLGHATSGTFPAGGPASVAGGGPGGGVGGFGGRGGARPGAGSPGVLSQLFGPGAPPGPPGASSSFCRLRREHAVRLPGSWERACAAVEGNLLLAGSGLRLIRATEKVRPACVDLRKEAYAGDRISEMSSPRSATLGIWRSRKG